MLTTILVALIAGSVPGLVAWFRDRKKNDTETEKMAAETEKAKAETRSIYEQVAERWAEHVGELQGKVDTQTKEIETLKSERADDKAEIKGLRKDIAQVRRENEDYRVQLDKRDAIIAKREAMIEDLKDWSNRLLNQVSKHAPHIAPEPFIERSNIWAPPMAE